jgi:RHS repeat-associated protein
MPPSTLQCFVIPWKVGEGKWMSFSGANRFKGISYVKRGYKTYELSNHLGNVLATVSDRRVSGTCTDSIVDFYDADILTISDYYPFGSPMEGRGQQTKTYRYGFNGAENDNEISGTGNSQDHKYRSYDPRLGRYKSIDPMTIQYPFYTPYQYAGNTPIMAIDLEGLQPETMIDKQGKLTTPMVSLLNSAFLMSKTSLQNATWQKYDANRKTKAWASMVGIPSSTAASVMGTTVVHDGSTTRTDGNWLRLIAHEQVHESHIESQGNFTFYSNYLIEGASTPYESIITERIAYQYGSAPNGTDYANQLLKFQGGVVMNTLNNPNLSEQTKATQLEAVGAKFRRDVLIPDHVNQLSGLIEQSNFMLAFDKSLSGTARTLLQQSIGGMQKQIEAYNAEQTQITKKYGN